MWCPVRGCGFESRALRFCNPKSRLPAAFFVLCPAATPVVLLA